MAEPIDVKLLHGQWLHVREEDTPTERVYRRAGAALPPSRGRAGLQFDTDGTFKQFGIGPTDISKVGQGEWHLDPADEGRLKVQVAGAPQSLEISALAPDRLVVKR
jgi:hypothetical protein